jgi:type VI secretion system secreted protein VgrG
MQVTTPLGADVLLLEALSGYESVSEPYELTLDLLSLKSDVDPDQLLRKGVTITVDTKEGGQRYFHGLIRRFSQGGRGRGNELTSYRAEVVPALWFLNLVTDCRVFQKMTAPQIVQQILTDAGVTFRSALSATYSKREYCVQYRESNFAFVSRLLEDEGIFYFFEHSDGAHTMVLADAPSAVKPGPAESARVSFAESATMELDDVIDTFEVENLVRPSKVTVVDYNDQVTKRLEGMSTAARAKEAQKNLALYDYPGKFDAKDGGDRVAKLRLEAEEATACLVTGTTNSRGFVSGHSVDITEHYRSSLNGSYLILSVTTAARITDYGASAGDISAGDTFTFEARFSAIPAKIPYRPPARTPKSIVHGTQTAVVVGPKGEEIHTDKFGRVKVQFFWDRLGKNDEQSSCFVRVSSAWAGKGWGAIHVPRIGQEVIVDFLEGDPDRPIITGRVYNSEQVVPYALPANGTQSGIKAHSSKQGETDKANELRFEDKKDAEEIYLRAQKDLNVIVVNNETRTVQEGNQSSTIEKGNRSIKVTKGNHDVMIAEGDETYTIAKGKQTVEIDKDRSVTIKTGNESLTVKMGNVTTSVDQGNVTQTVKMGNVEQTVNMGNVTNTVKMGNVTTKLNLGKDSTEAMQGIEFKVGQNSIKIDQMGITLKGMMVKIEGQVQVQIKGLMTQVNADAMLQVKGAITMIN